MNEKLFNKAKNELIDSLSQNEERCQESIEDVRSCNNIKELVDVLNKYRIFIKNESLPNTDYMRKWFGKYIEELNECNVYLDQTFDLRQSDNDKELWLYGVCDCRLFIDKIKMQHIVLHGDSLLRLNMRNWGLAHIILKDNSNIIFEQRGARDSVMIIDKRV